MGDFNQVMNDELQNENPAKPSRHLLLFAFVVWFISSIIAIGTIGLQKHEILNWDEVDYVVAARQGIAANALDRTAFYAGDLFRMLRAKLQKSDIKLKNPYNENDDVFQLRHTHPPLLSYVLTLPGLDKLGPGFESWQLAVQKAGGALLIATMIFGYLRLSGDCSTGAGLLSVASIATLLSVILAAELQCHLWIAVSLVPTSLAVGKLIRQPCLKNATIVGIWCGIGFLGLQTGLFVLFLGLISFLVSLLITLFHDMQRSQIKHVAIRFIQMSGVVIASFFLTVLVTYPGALVRFSMLRIFAVYGYAIFRGEEYSGVALNYVNILMQIWPAILFGILLIVIKTPRTSRSVSFESLAFLIIGAGYAAILFKFLLSVTYVAPALVLLSVAGVAAVSSLRRRNLELFLTMVALTGSGFCITQHFGESHRISWDQMNQIVSITSKAPAYVEGFHILRFYSKKDSAAIKPLLFGKGGRVATSRDPERLVYNTISMDDLTGHLLLVGFFNKTDVNAFEKSIPANIERLQIPGSTGRIYYFSRHGEKFAELSTGTE